MRTSATLLAMLVTLGCGGDDSSLTNGPDLTTDDSTSTSTSTSSSTGFTSVTDTDTSTTTTDPGTSSSTGVETSGSSGSSGEGTDGSSSTGADEACGSDLWTLVGVISPDDADSWTDPTAWTDSSTFGSPANLDQDYKAAEWSSMAWTQICFIGTGVKTSTPDAFGDTSLAAFFGSTTLVSLTGEEMDWAYNNGDFTTDNDHEFFAEVQNPATTADVNLSERNACIIATAYDGWEVSTGVFDDTVQGFGCSAGTGTGPNESCYEETCGDAIREGTTRIYIR